MVVLDAPQDRIPVQFDADMTGHLDTYPAHDGRELDAGPGLGQPDGRKVKLDSTHDGRGLSAAEVLRLDGTVQPGEDGEGGQLIFLAAGKSGRRRAPKSADQD